MAESGSTQPSTLIGAFEHEDRWALLGDISQISLASVLQFLELGRHTGVMVCEELGGTRGECALREGRVVSARHQHLVGSEAVIAILACRQGRFAFGVESFGATAERSFSASPVIMEAVRLEDEMERFAAGYPGDDFVMQLRDPHEIPTDPVGCGADIVMATLSARNGATVRELVESVSLAPIKVRLSAAWLGFTDRLRSRAGSRQNLPAMSSAKLPWLNHLLLRFSGSVRVVLSVESTHATHDVIGGIKALARALDSGPAWMSFGPDGTSMARVRPRTGGLLSIASVPRTEELLRSFADLAATADLVLLCVGSSDTDMREWESAVTQTPVLHVSDRPTGACLAKALERFAASLVQRGSYQKTAGGT